MKIRSVRVNNHKRSFEVSVSRRGLSYPFAKTDPSPTAEDPVARVYVDPEIGREGFTYLLESGREGTVHIDHILDYDQDPAYMRNLLLYRLTVEAQRRLDASPLARREIIRRPGTSATQFYRILDTTNDRKSIDQVLRLLQVLDCEVDLVVRDK